jgi:fluoride exporter
MPVSLAVALGGALGSLARYGLDPLIERRSASIFPWATFTVNVTGCLLIPSISLRRAERPWRSRTRPRPSRAVWGQCCSERGWANTSERP